MNIVVEDDVALQELALQLEDLNSIVNQIIKMRSDNMFRFLSKKSRNEILDSMIEKTGAVEDASKAAVRSIRKTKRIPLPDEIADLLIANRRHIAVAAMPDISGSPSV